MVIVRSLFVCFILLAVVGCDSLSSIIRKDDEGRVKGERISLLKTDSDVKSDSSIADVEVRLPHTTRNEIWLKSTGNNILTNTHPHAPHIFSDIVNNSAGSGVSYSKISATPVVADGKVFTVDALGVVTAFNARNIKERIWKYKIGLTQDKSNYANAGMSFYQGKLFVTTGSNLVIAIDGETGNEIWKRSIGSLARSAPAVTEGMIFVNTISNSLYALGSSDGRLIWVHSGTAEEVSVLGSASPVVAGDIVIAPYSSGEIFALRKKDGSVVWSDNFSIGSSDVAYSLSDIEASPIVKGDKVYAVSNDGYLAATTLLYGVRAWEQEISAASTPWVAGNFLYMISNDNDLICLYLPSGAVKWVKKMPSYKNEKKKEGDITWSGPVLGGGYLFLVGSNGKLALLSPYDGEIKYTYNVPTGIFVRPVIAYDRVYLYNNDALLVSMGRNEDDPFVEDIEKRASKKVHEERMKEKARVKNNPVVHTIDKDDRPAIGKFFNGIKGLFGGGEKDSGEDQQEADDKK